MFMHDVSLKSYSSYRIGGKAKHFFEAKTEKLLIEALEEAEREKLAVFILGGGTNILFSDKGFNGLVLKPSFENIEVSGDTIRAGAGALMKNVIEASIKAGLSGLEWAGGLPGTFGGAIRGNAGAFGGEMKDAIQTVRSINVKTREILDREHKDCHFGYRMSVFKEKGDEVILFATLALQKGDGAAIKNAVEEKIRYRNDRHPMEYPNVGSIFKNVDARGMSEADLKPFARVIKNDPFPVIPTAYLLSEAGLKGVSFGGAMFSPKHPNFIVNVLNASESDVRTLIELGKQTIKEKFGIDLEEEVMYV